MAFKGTSDLGTTDRATLTGDAYADQHHLAARQALYEWQSPHHDLPRMVSGELTGVRGLVVDVGCGNGKYVQSLRAERPDLLVLGLDISPGILRSIEHPVVVADAQQLPLADESAGAVLAMHMLYHLPDIDAGIAELRRVLRPGGVTLVSTNGATDKVELNDLWVSAARDVLDRSAGMGRVSLSARFTLEDAPAMLHRHFAAIRLIELSGIIAVADPEPVVAHLASYRPWAGERGPPFDAVIRRARERVAKIIEREGKFEISSRGGILVCR